MAYPSRRPASDLISLVPQELHQTRLALSARYPGEEGLERIKSLEAIMALIAEVRLCVKAAGPAPGGGCWLSFGLQSSENRIFMWSSAKSPCEWQSKHEVMRGSYYTDNTESCADLRKRLSGFYEVDFWANAKKDQKKFEEETEIAGMCRSAGGC